MRLSLVGRGVRDQRFAIIVGGIGIVAICIYLAYVYTFIGKGASEMLKLLERMPSFVRDFINPGLLTSPEGFFNLQPFSILAPLVLVGYAIARGSDLVAGEEERGTLDLLLSSPLRRSQVLMQKSLATALVLLFFAAMFWVGMAAGCRAFTIHLDHGRLLQAVVSCLLLSFTCGALALALGCLFGRKRLSVSLASCLVVLAYLVHSYAPMVPSLRPWRKFSFFHYYNGDVVLVNGLKLASAAVQAGLFLCFFLLALLFFERRDLRV